MSDGLRYDVAAVRAFARQLFEAAGLAPDKIDSVVRSLVTADMMGHTTHGLAIAPWYLQEARSGAMALHGEPEVLSDRGACVAWNGRRLPGAWLIDRAIDVALERIEAHGVVTCTIANGYHTGALATYLPRLTERGLMVVLACSGPAHSGVAPFGGTRGVFTPNPLAAGMPSGGDPVLLDISCSITTIKRSTQVAKAGGRLPGQWVMDAHGEPTDDPAVLLQGDGSLLPVGGLDHGHKGYAMALLVESLTQGLSGYGRRDGPTGTVMNTFLQVLDPAAFGGRCAFTDETDWLIEACHANPPRPGVDRVRIPGDRAMARQRTALAEGVALDQAILDGLAPYASACGLALPQALNQRDIQAA
ncbi:Ldh family oxidoreductase [Variovorax boronicumulans]